VTIEFRGTTPIFSNLVLRNIVPLTASNQAALCAYESILLLVRLTS
jgi:hypothetical protein